MKYRKKPVVIDAVQIPFTVDEEHDILLAFLHDHVVPFEIVGGDSAYMVIHTLEGDMFAQRGDWIIKGVQGEFYPCKPDIFEETYDPVDV
jgi:hypothetical protein